MTSLWKSGESSICSLIGSLPASNQRVRSVQQKAASSDEGPVARFSPCSLRVLESARGTVFVFGDQIPVVGVLVVRIQVLECMYSSDVQCILRCCYVFYLVPPHGVLDLKKLACSTCSSANEATGLDLVEHR